MQDWNHFRLVLAVGRARSIAEAAKSLGIDHSTVFRQLNAAERHIGVRLFERLPNGVYQPTAAGSRMISAAENMEDQTLGLDRDIAGGDHRLVGNLRFTSSETLAYRILPPHLAAFRKAHPGIVVELAIDNRILSLSRREADVALRPQRPKENVLWGRKISTVAWGIYGARAYLRGKRHSIATARDLSNHPLIGWDETSPRFGAADWLEQIASSKAFVFRTASLLGQLAAAKEGVGLAALPCYLGDLEPDLTRALSRPIERLEAELWVVTHADLRNTARIRAFLDLITEQLAKQRRLFEGQLNLRKAS